MGPSINIPTLSNPDLASGQPAVVKTSLWNFIISDKRNRKLLRIALGGLILQFIIFKLLYPFPDFFSDSYSYLFAAYAHLDVSIWPIGYSKFLLLFHSLTHSGTALVAFQYLFLEVACLYFFYTILYFFRPAKNTTNIFFFFLFFNPLFLYISNYVNSDPLFIALSLFWFTQLIWIIFRPKNYQIFTQAILLFLCFTIRNNAYYYPLVTLLAFSLSAKRLPWKIAGTLAPFLLIIPFIIHTRNAAYQMTGTHQFSLFTGWQLANNALYIYKDLPVDPEDFSSPAARELDSLSKKFHEHLISNFDEYLDQYVGNFFIREPVSPLKQYMEKHYAVTDGYSGVAAWGKASPVFEEFGKTIIKNNFSAYVRNYMLLNAKNYFAPPLEKLEVYNLGLDSIENIAIYWFDFKHNRVQSVSRHLQGSVLYIFVPLFFILNLYMLIWFIQYLIRKKYRNAGSIFNKTLVLTSGLLVANFCFCVVATIIVFRYEVFPLIIAFSVSLLLLEWSDKKELQKEKQTVIKENQPGLAYSTLTPSTQDNTL